MAVSTKPGSGPLKHLRRTFIAGVLAALPLALTLAVIFWLAEFLQRFLGPGSTFGRLLGSIGLRFVASDAVAYLIGVLVALTAIYLLGLFVEAGMKSRWQRLLDHLVRRVPLVNTVYNTLNRLMRLFEQKEQSEIKSMAAVIVHFGGREGESVKALALLTSTEPVQLSTGACYAVMVPTAPVPFGGAILFAPVDWVEFVDLSFEGLLNIYMSMGVTSPDYFHANKS
jgi:uncharacterized membrane protein